MLIDEASTMLSKLFLNFNGWSFSFFNFSIFEMQKFFLLWWKFWPVQVSFRLITFSYRSETWSLWVLNKKKKLCS